MDQPNDTQFMPRKSKKLLWVIIAVIAAAAAVIIVLAFVGGSTNTASSGNNANPDANANQKSAGVKNGEGAEADLPATPSNPDEIVQTYLAERDFAALTGHLSAQVNVIQEATECCGKVAPTEAVQIVEAYTEDINTFDFDQNQNLVKELKKRDPALAKHAIGIGDDEFVLAYRLNAQGKIDDIYMAITYKIVGY